jgi:zinc protease
LFQYLSQQLPAYPNNTVIKDELARTKTQLEAEFVFEQDRISTQSYYLGMLATVGLGIETMFTYEAICCSLTKALDSPLFNTYDSMSKA